MRSPGGASRAVRKYEGPHSPLSTNQRRVGALPLPALLRSMLAATHWIPGQRGSFGDVSREGAKGEEKILP